MQPCRINVNSSGALLSNCPDALPTGNYLDLSAGFNLGSGDNGNVTQFTAAGQQTFNRSYTYDSLNRIQTMSAPGDACSGLSWTIDPWSNRTAQTATGGSCFSPTVNVNSQNQLSGAPYQYDVAGTLLKDGNHTYAYDAENRIVTVDGGGTATYVYDGLGNRVEKTAGTDEQYLRDTSGQLNTVFSNGAFQKMYVYADGKPLAEYTSTATEFVHTDNLGSIRLLSSTNQSVQESDDYYPFGEPIVAGTGDGLKFTGKERDSESNLDYFGARYYGSSLGRFMTPDLDDLSDDPGPAPYADFRDPQTLNLYSYVRNNPLNRIDPDGHKLVCTSSSSSDDQGNIKVTVNCHEEPDQPPPQPSIVDQIRMFFFSDVSDPADKRAIIGSIFRSVVNGGNAGNLNSLLPNVATNSNTPPLPTIPLKALKVLDAIDASSSAGPNIQGGQNFQNREGKLPPTDGSGNAIQYKEWDVNQKQAGVGRGAERVVTGSDGSAYYTSDHYQTFQKVR